MQFRAEVRSALSCFDALCASLVSSQERQARIFDYLMRRDGKRP
ncbi:MAG: hypothetical protein NZ772_16390 [Cyanobacteria bacterium]|nr:hypothetical protein [Cyanobacteriota bacterium]MDW8202915.1 hypothetical protein [Cyanobacteriota bacterium SKYGB_h_bin112]